MPEIENQFSFVGRVGLPVEVAQMAPDGGGRDTEGGRDHFVLQTAATERQDIGLAPGQLSTSGQRCDGFVCQRRQSSLRRGPRYWLATFVRLVGTFRADRAEEVAGVSGRRGRARRRRPASET